MTTSSGQEQACAQVARLGYCYDEECEYSQDLHLVVEMIEVPLLRGNATAISYTWGEFDRSKTPIGHYSDTARTSVLMELGREWILADLINSLAELGRASPCWIDQLCIPQADQAIRVALASIPSIFRKFDVVALLPGRPCRCLQKAVEMCDEIDGLPDQIPTWDKHIDLAWDRAFYRLGSYMRLKMPMCFNSASASSWFERIWTRQELLYSRRIRAVWTSPDEPQCVFDLKAPPEGMRDDEPPDIFGGNPKNTDKLREEDLVALCQVLRNHEGWKHFHPQNLTPYMALLWSTHVPEDVRSRVEAGLPLSNPMVPHTALTRMRHIQESFLKNSITDFATFADAEGPMDPKALVYLCRFLSGATIESQLPIPDSQDTKMDLQRFLFALGRLPGYMFRKSTHARDFVTSIWVDCPKYEVPAAYKSMDVSYLLQNALDQLKLHHGVSLLSTAPSSLFSRDSKSILWEPCKYLEGVEANDTSEVYGPLGSMKLMPLEIESGGRVPLTLLTNRFRSMDFEKYYRNHGNDEWTILQKVREICKEWTVDARSKMQITASYYKSSRYDCRTESSMEMLIQWVLSIDKHNGFGDFIPSFWRHKPFLEALIGDMDICSVVYNMVAYALGLHPEACRGQGLRLVMTTGDSFPHCIGFRRPEIEDVNTCHEQAPLRDTITVCAERGNYQRGYKLFEAVKISGTVSPTLYRVVGVWVPMKITSFDDLGGIVQESSSDACLI